MPYTGVASPIVWANLIMVIVGLFTVILELGLEGVAYSRALKGVLNILFRTSIILYTIFTFQLPWADVFVETDWR
jgi:hypothetical protein